MKKNLTACLVFFALISTAQITPTWVTGIDTFNQRGTYGVKGVAASSNIPGARQNSTTWTDNAGNLWLFGGNGYSSTTSIGFLNDLWKYDITANKWTWLSGNNTTNQHGVYGTINVASSSNFPGARQNAVTWVDASGNLWLFGGNGYAAGGALTYLNDLWKYDIGANQWTWMSGSNTGVPPSVYGTQGVASSSNVPGGRFGSAAWIDNSNNLWVFGGQQNTGTITRLNDLWRYTISTGQWTWISGSNTTNQNGIYGTKGVTNIANAPGARQATVYWKDNAGNFWMFGGDGFAKSNATNLYMDDLWKYDVALNEWTWMNGTDTVSQPAVYGTKGVAASSYIPGARQLSIAFKDNAGDLWMFGGWGYIGPPFGRMNDLWRYKTSTNQWTWMAGANSVNQAGTYGTMGVGSTTNIPGARRMSIAWSDNTGKFWLFGGTGYDKRDSLGLLSDLWMIDVNVSMGIENNNSQETSLNSYPVPFENKINVEFYDFKKHEIEIVDFSGKIILKDNFFGKKEIDLSAFANGIYLIRAGVETRKIVKH